MALKPYFHNVKYYETDQMAIVHHSNYIRWFEEARIDWLAQAEIDYVDMERRGIIIPVLGVSAQYKTMTRFGDTVEIIITGGVYNGVRMEVSYEVRDAETQELRATGSSQHCFLDRENRVLNLKRAAPDLHQKFQAALPSQAK
jgi:acyl-CoA thioester hydrolase